jgi:hypothetical protein
LSIGAPSDTASTFIITQIDDTDFSKGNLVVQYDSIEIQQLSISQLLNPDGLDEAGYVLLDTSDGVFIAVFIPHFSEHTIIISSLIEAVGGITAVIFYAVICIVAVAVFFGSSLTNFIRFKRYFRKK